MEKFVNGDYCVVLLIICIIIVVIVCAYIIEYLVNSFVNAPDNRVNRTICYCTCGNDLVIDSFSSDDENGVKYECSECGENSVWNFDIAPVPIRIDNK